MNTKLINKPTTCCAAALSALLLFSSPPSLAQQHQHNDKPRPSFSDFDTDQSGIISLAEFLDFPAPPHAKHQPAEIFARIDTNNDEVLSKEEFESHKPPKRERSHSNYSNEKERY